MASPFLGQTGRGTGKGVCVTLMDLLDWLTDFPHTKARGLLPTLPLPGMRPGTSPPLPPPPHLAFPCPSLFNAGLVGKFLWVHFTIFVFFSLLSSWTVCNAIRKKGSEMGQNGFSLAYLLHVYFCCNLSLRDKRCNMNLSRDALWQESHEQLW